MPAPVPANPLAALLQILQRAQGGVAPGGPGMPMPGRPDLPPMSGRMPPVGGIGRQPSGQAAPGTYEQLLTRLRGR